ncbi:MAG: hypothetical protein KGJ80_02225 [Chloroflexota bacterium]|nr:hypothetical protein [Chloroflexota bacterium]
MQDPKSLNRRYETVAWGAFFILLGITNLFRGLPEGVGAVGIGFIFLGLNLARYLSQIPTSGFTSTLGVLAVVLGGADLLRDLVNLRVDLPIFPLLLIAIGMIWLVRGLTRGVGR